MTNASRPQPPPHPGKEPVIDVVLADLKERAEDGYRKYGTFLETHNGRDALWDAYQEQVDLIFYTRQHIIEREEETKELCNLYALLVGNTHPEKDVITESAVLLSRILHRRNDCGLVKDLLQTQG